MSQKGPLHSPAARPQGSAAKVDPAALAAQINVEAQTATLTDDGTSRWGIVKFNEGKRVGWVRTDLSFVLAKNTASDFNSCVSDLGIEYKVERQPDPEPVSGIWRPVRSKSKLTTQQHYALYKHYQKRHAEMAEALKAHTGSIDERASLVLDYGDMFTKFVSHKRAWRPDVQPAALELEEASHQSSRDAAQQIITDLRAQVEQLQGALEMKCQDEANALAALAQTQKQITELQSRPDDPALTAAPNDNLTLAYLRKWYEGLSKADRDAQPLLIHDLIAPWHKRSIVWTQIVQSCSGKVGVTPYEASPPKSAVKGQGAIRPKPAA
jgi:hypothetical protein